MQAPGDVCAKQRAREIAPVVHHHVVVRQRVQMGQRGLSFVAMGDQVEVHRDARAQPVQTTEQALGVVRVVRRGAVAGRDQRARQVQLRAVHREQPMPLPARPHGGLAGAPEQLGVQCAEQVLVHLGAGGAHRRGRHRGGLRQRHALATALVPQLGQGRAVPLLVLRQHQAEHEQHHEQRVQRTPTPLPVPVEVASHRHHRVDQRPPPLGQGVRRTPRRRRARRAPAPFDQDRPEVLVHCTKTLFGVRADRLPAVSPRWRQFAAR